MREVDCNAVDTWLVSTLLSDFLFWSGHGEFLCLLYQFCSMVLELDMRAGGSPQRCKILFSWFYLWFGPNFPFFVVRTCFKNRSEISFISFCTQHEKGID